MMLSPIAQVSSSPVLPAAPTLDEALVRLRSSCLAATTPTLVSERHPTHPVRVHIRCPGGFVSYLAADAGARALMVVDAVWVSMTGLMGAPRLDGVEGGDDAIDIYVSDLEVSTLLAGRQVATADLGATVATAITPAEDDRAHTC